jgi:hypothetical protein
MVVHGLDHARIHIVPALAVLAFRSLGRFRGATRDGLLARAWRGLVMAFSLSRMQDFALHDEGGVYRNKPSMAAGPVQNAAVT